MSAATDIQQYKAAGVPHDVIWTQFKSHTAYKELKDNGFDDDYIIKELGLNVGEQKKPNKGIILKSPATMQDDFKRKMSYQPMKQEAIPPIQKKAAEYELNKAKTAYPYKILKTAMNVGVGGGIPNLFGKGMNIAAPKPLLDFGSLKAENKPTPKLEIGSDAGSDVSPAIVPTRVTPDVLEYEKSFKSQEAYEKTIKPAVEKSIKAHPVLGRLNSAAQAVFPTDDLVGNALTKVYPGSYLGAKMLEYIIARQMLPIDITGADSVFGLGETATAHNALGISSNLPKLLYYLDSGLKFSIPWATIKLKDAFSKIMVGDKEPTVKDLVITPISEGLFTTMIGAITAAPSPMIRQAGRGVGVASLNIARSLIDKGELTKFDIGKALSLGFAGGIMEHFRGGKAIDDMQSKLDKIKVDDVEPVKLAKDIGEEIGKSKVGKQIIDQLTNGKNIEGAQDAIKSAIDSGDYENAIDKGLEAMNADINSAISALSEVDKKALGIIQDAIKEGATPPTIDEARNLIKISRQQPLSEAKKIFTQEHKEAAKSMKKMYMTIFDKAKKRLKTQERTFDYVMKLLRKGAKQDEIDKALRNMMTDAFGRVRQGGMLIPNEDLNKELNLLMEKLDKVDYDYDKSKQVLERFMRRKGGQVLDAIKANQADRADAIDRKIQLVNKYYKIADTGRNIETLRGMKEYSKDLAADTNKKLRALTEEFKIKTAIMKADKKEAQKILKTLLDKKTGETEQTELVNSIRKILKSKDIVDKTPLLKQLNVYQGKILAEKIQQFIDTGKINVEAFHKTEKRLADKAIDLLVRANKKEGSLLKSIPIHEWNFDAELARRVDEHVARAVSEGIEVTDELKQEFIDRVNSEGYRPSILNPKLKPAHLTGVRSKLAEFFTSDQTKLLTLCDAIDSGDKDGPAKRLIFDRVLKSCLSEFHDNSMRDKLDAGLKHSISLSDAKAVLELSGSDINSPDNVKLKLTSQEVLSLYMGLYNADTTAKIKDIAEGWGLSDAGIEKVKLFMLEHPTLFNVSKYLNNYYNEVKPILKELGVKLSGHHVKSVDYYTSARLNEYIADTFYKDDPAYYRWLTGSDSNVDSDDKLKFMKRFMRARTGDKRAHVLGEWDKYQRIRRSVAHLKAYGKTMHLLDKITSDPQFKALAKANKFVGDNGYNNLRVLLQRINGNTYTDMNNGTETFFDVARSHITVNVLGTARTARRRLFSFFPFLHRANYRVDIFAEEALKIAGDKDYRNMILDKATVLKERWLKWGIEADELNNYFRKLDTFARTNKWLELRNSWNRFWLYAPAYVDGSVSLPAWATYYKQAYNMKLATGVSPGIADRYAIDYANREIHVTFPSVSAPMRSIHQSDQSQLKKWAVNMFRTNSETIFNFLKMERIKLASGRQNILGYLLAMTSGVVVPAVIEESLRQVSKHPTKRDSQYVWRIAQDTSSLFPLGYGITTSLRWGLDDRIEYLLKDIKKAKRASNKGQYDDALKYLFYSSGPLIGIVGPSEIKHWDRFIENSKPK